MQFSSAMNITASIVSERDRALLGGDYATYHAQTTRRIHALRRKLGNATLRGRKYTPKNPVRAEDVANSPQWVQLLLASSERAWAEAMSMKSLQSPENTQKHMAGSTKKQILSRFRRAITFASNLVEALLNNISGATKVDILEAKAYLAMLEGGLDFEKNRWQSCLQKYAIARLAYTTLGDVTKLDVFRELLSGTVDPSIKYAAYQTKLPRTKAVGDIAIEKFPSSEAETRREIETLDTEAFKTAVEKAALAKSDAPTNLPTTITWRSRKVKIEDASVSLALGNALDKETALGEAYSAFVESNLAAKEVAAAYEGAIDAMQEAVDVTRDTIEELRSEGVDQGDPRIQSLQVTRTAVNYAMIEWRIGRNRILCGKDDGLKLDSSGNRSNVKSGSQTKSPTVKEESSGKTLARLRERVALYDLILQSLDTVKELPGVAADSEFVEETDGKKAYFRALKCLTIGRSHAIRDNLKNALALYSRAGDITNQAALLLKSSSGSSHGPIKLDVTSDQLNSAQTYLTALTLQYRALVDLKRVDGADRSRDTSSASPLIERFHLNQYDAEADLRHLVNYPPKLQPVPVKPLFFDLAWNYIQYPGQEKQRDQPDTRGEPEVTQEQKSSKRGWFGFGR